MKTRLSLTQPMRKKSALFAAIALCGLCAAGAAERLLSEGHEVLGFFFSNHPVLKYDELAQTYCTCKVKDILAGAQQDEEEAADAGNGGKDELPADGETVVFVARVGGVSKKMTRKGKRMAVLTSYQSLLEILGLGDEELYLPTTTSDLSTIVHEVINHESG